MIGFLDLMSVFHTLAKHAVFVTNAVAHDGKLETGATIHETGRQPAQTAVTESGVLLAVRQAFQFESQGVQSLVYRFGQSQIQHGIAEGASHQVFQG